MESFTNSKCGKTLLYNKKKLPQKGKKVKSCAFLRSKIQNLRNLWQILWDCMVAPFINSAYSIIKGEEYEVTNEWKGCGYGHKADPLIYY